MGVILCSLIHLNTGNLNCRQPEMIVDVQYAIEEHLADVVTCSAMKAGKGAK